MVVFPADIMDRLIFVVTLIFVLLDDIYTSASLKIKKEKKVEKQSRKQTQQKTDLLLGRLHCASPYVSAFTQECVLVATPPSPIKKNK